jgi:uncharacterized protein YodC (DUF2158 family)
MPSNLQLYKTGDVVQLKSGGPWMTVRGYEPTDSDEVLCEWFTGDLRYEKAFKQDMLNRYEPTPSFYSTKRENPNRY